MAGHFCALARRVSGWQRASQTAEPVGSFLDYERPLMADWLEAWQARDPVRQHAGAGRSGRWRSCSFSTP